MTKPAGLLASRYEDQYPAFHGQPVIQPEHSDYLRRHAAELARFVNKPVADISVADIGGAYPTFLEVAVAAGASLVVAVNPSAKKPKAQSYGADRGADCDYPR